MPEASIGRIVRYVGEGTGKPHPAQIVGVHDQESGHPLLNLVVTLDGSNDFADGGADNKLHVWRTSIAHAEPLKDGILGPFGTPYAPASWHWPDGVR